MDRLKSNLLIAVPLSLFAKLLLWNVIIKFFESALRGVVFTSTLIAKLMNSNFTTFSRDSRDITGSCQCEDTFYRLHFTPTSQNFVATYIRF